MNTTTKKRTTMVRLVAFGLLLATLLAALSPMALAGAAGTSGKAYSWGDNYFGQLGNGTSGIVSDAPLGVKNLTGVKNIDGGFSFTLAVAQ